MIDPYDMGGSLPPSPAPLWPADPVPFPAPSPPGPAPSPAPAPVLPAKIPFDWAKWLPWLLVAALVVGFGGWTWWQKQAGPTPGPAPISDYDPAFLAVGRRFAAQLGIDWAKSNGAAAALYQGGQSRKAADDAAAEQFRTDRMTSYRTIVGVELEKLVPHTKPEAEITIDDRAKLARAHRGMQKGVAP